MRLLVVFFAVVCAVSFECYSHLDHQASLSQIAYCIRDALSLGQNGNFEFPEALAPFTSIRYDESLGDAKRYEIRQVFAPETTGSSYLLVDHLRRTVNLVFRGSRNQQDWATNLKFFPVQYQPKAGQDWKGDKQYWVHSGFDEVVSSVFPTVLEATTSVLEETGYKLEIAGHSMGGGLALLCGLEFSLLGVPLSVTTFSTPRVMSPSLARLQDTLFPHYRVVHKGDLIPYIPIGPSWQHSGRLFYVSKKLLPHSSDDISTSDAEDAVAETDIMDRIKRKLGAVEHSNLLRSFCKCGRL